MKHFVVVKLKSRDYPVRGQITPPTSLSKANVAISGEAYFRTQVEWVDGSQDGRKVAESLGYNLLEPSVWYVYGPAYRMESIAEGKRKASARRALLEPSITSK